MLINSLRDRRLDRAALEPIIQELPIPPYSRLLTSLLLLEVLNLLFHLTCKYPKLLHPLTIVKSLGHQRLLDLTLVLPELRHAKRLILALESLAHELASFPLVLENGDLFFKSLDFVFLDLDHVSLTRDYLEKSILFV